MNFSLNDASGSPRIDGPLDTLPAMRLPDLVIAGAQKCGTSTLHTCLLSHADIRGPSDPHSRLPVKEVNFFSNRWDQGLDWYRSHFAATDGVCLDSTPNYLSDIRAHERMGDIIPSARLIVSLRDPITRAYSQFNHYSQDIVQSKKWDWRLPGASFADNVRAELSKPKRRWYGLVGRGYYIRQLEHLFRLFPRERVHIVIMERWIQDPDSCFDAILDFAGLPRQPLQKVAVHMRPYTVEPLSDDVVELLRDTYRPFNERLFNLLGGPIAEWL